MGNFHPGHSLMLNLNSYLAKDGCLSEDNKSNLFGFVILIWAVNFVELNHWTRGRFISSRFRSNLYPIDLLRSVIMSQNTRLTFRHCPYATRDGKWFAFGFVRPCLWFFLRSLESWFSTSLKHCHLVLTRRWRLVTWCVGGEWPLSIMYGLFLEGLCRVTCLHALGFAGCCTRSVVLGHDELPAGAKDWQCFVPPQSFVSRKFHSLTRYFPCRACRRL